IAGIAMTVAMLLLALFGVATPLAMIGDRLSVFIKPGPFLSIMGKVGGYNHLKQLGVGSTMAGQVFVSALAGALFGLFMRQGPARSDFGRPWRSDCRRRCGDTAQTLSRRHIQLRRHSIQRPDRPTDYTKRFVLLRDQERDRSARRCSSLAFGSKRARAKSGHVS